MAAAEDDAPALWAAEELAAPLAERLRAHFASGRATDRPDRPEWLFGTAARLAASLAPGLAPLQPAVDAHGLGGAYHLPLEFVRALRGAVQVGFYSSGFRAVVCSVHGPEGWQVPCCWTLGRRAVQVHSCGAPTPQHPEASRTVLLPDASRGRARRC